MPALEGEWRANMRTIRILGILAIVLATTCVSTSASACSKGYFRCGGACCPSR